MNKFNYREKSILKDFIHLADDQNRCLLPTNSLFLQEVYFRKNKDSFFIRIQDRNLLFVRTSFSEVERKQQLYLFCEVLYLFDTLVKENYINVFPLSLDSNVFCMRPDIGKFKSDCPTRIHFINTNDSIEWGNKVLALYNAQDEEIFTPIEIDGKFDEIIKNTINAGVFISEDLITLVKNDFKTSEELYAEKSLLLSRWGIGIAIVIGIISILIGAASLYYTAAAFPHSNIPVQAPSSHSRVK